MHIWLRIIALRLFSSSTPDSKMDIFAWLSNIYRWKIYLWHVSYTLRKTKCLKCIKQHRYIPCHGGSIWSTIDIKGCMLKNKRTQIS